jgi:protein YIPF1/2
VLLDTFSRPGKGAKGSSDESNQATGWFSMFSVAAYRPYFDVDTSDVLERIKDSLFPFRGSFNEKTTDNPDLSVFIFIYDSYVFVASLPPWWLMQLQKYCWIKAILAT